MFPPFLDDADSPSTNQEYSSFAFWREPIPALELEEKEEIAEKQEQNKDDV